MHENHMQKIRNVCELTRRHYQPGRQDRSYKAIWRNLIYPLYPMCYRTFLNYVNTYLQPGKAESSK